MDPVQYYVTTLSTAFKNLAPIVAFILVGYVVFFKLPFLFFLRNMKISKQEFQRVDDFPPLKNKFDESDDFQRRMRVLNAPKRERPKDESQKSEAPKKPKPRSKTLSAEEVFCLDPDMAFTKKELKKKYHDLLKMNHPDKVAFLGADSKRKAELKTKEINSAYIKLKMRAA